MKYLYVISGSLCVALAVAGIFLPLLPTTPLLLLAAWLYFRGSDRLYSWLIGHRVFGRYIREYRESRSIPLKAKVTALVLMWVTIPYCIFFHIPYLWVSILLAVILVSVSWYILSLKTS